MRLHELAKEIEVDSKDLLALAKKLGLAVKSHSSNLAPGEIGLLKVGYRFRDLDEDEIYDKLEEEQNRKEEEEKVEKEAHREAQVRRKAERDAEVVEVVEVEEPVEATDEFEELIEIDVDEEEAEELETAEPEFEGVGLEVEDAVIPEAAQAAETAGATEAEAPATVTEAPRSAEMVETDRKEAARVARGGAKILGRIVLEPAEVARSEATHERIAPISDPTKRGHGTEPDPAQRQRRKAVPKPAKWQPDPDEFSPVSSTQVAKPKFWERGPQRRGRGRSRPGASRSRGPKKNLRAESELTIVVPITVKDFSQEMGIRANEILGKLLMSEGKPLTINSFLDEQMVETLAGEFGREIDIRPEEDVEEIFLKKESADIADEVSDTGEVEEGGEPRPAVVTFMGHVDHGKTSLLDKIRESSVVDTEHGGITQHIRAYSVTTKKGGKVTFLDTPGHRAFTEMRARGANCTDIVVLVVAGDDGVKPQTVEALEHARAADPDMPIVIALNKMDRNESDAMRVKQELMGIDILPEEFGGKIGVVECSAITGQGIDALLERLVLESELHSLSGHADRKARGYVIEASKEVGKGVVATVLVRDGTLKVRDPFLCGSSWGRVRMMEDDQGKPIKEAGPSTPVRVYGFKGDVPGVGVEFLAVADERGAEEVASDRSMKERLGDTTQREAVTLDNLFESLTAEKVHEINVVIKADVQGSVEVLKRELSALEHEEVKVRVLRAGVGGITEEDVMLAATSEATVIGFGVAPDAKARRIQDRLGAEIRTYNVIYEILDDLKKAMAGALAPEESENVVGHVEVRQVFKISRMGSIAGCHVSDGMIRRNDKVRVLRDGKIIHTTGLDSLKRFKDDVREVKEGYECGVKLAGFDDIKIGDVFESFEVVFLERELTIN